MKAKKITRRSIAGACVVTGVCLLVLALTPTVGAQKTKPSPAPKPAAEAVKANRTLPKVQPPKGGLQFSTQPTVQEIFQARIFEEPLVPIGSAAAAETATLAAALLEYAKRSGPDDFSSLTSFLKKHPKSAWRASLLTNFGLEYYNTGHYSLALTAWTEAWALAKDATEPKAKGIADRAAGELAGMYARLGRMDDLEPLLKSVEDRVFVGAATERISGARAGLANMKERPEIAFKCGPLALHRIKLSIDPANAGDATIIKAASTQKGFSLPQVAELSSKIGLDYQMAFREKGAEIAVPSVVHWGVGHYAAIVRQEGDRFLIQDPTFLNDVWVTREALEAESSGYFLIPKQELNPGWRAVTAEEGATIWGKGNVGGNDPKPTGSPDPKKPKPCPPKRKGMAVPDAHLMLASLNIVDEPVGYSPPVGPAISFVITYNQREAFQPAGFSYSNFGPKWTFDWLSYITDNPVSPSADANQFLRGGGTRTFTGFNPSTQTFASQQFDQTRLTRTSPSSYEILSPDGSKQIFGQSDGSMGTSRKVFLTQVVDPHGNAVSLTYDANFRLVAITDAIGQVSTIAYTNPIDIYRVTKITDPFGRFATFDYDLSGRLSQITDVIGIASQFAYEGSSDFINALTTPYGVTAFSKGESGTTRWLETLYPNGERDRVEFNQATNLGIPQSVPANQLPTGMNTHNDYMSYRNTYYWNRNAYAQSYPDYTKARLYHWLHTADGSSAAGILESEKEPLEGRIWYDYPVQGGNPSAIFVGTSNKPTHIGRVLDDGTTQLYTYEYDGFGNVTKSIDPIGRTTSYVYAANGLDLLEVRQMRAGNTELLQRNTFDAQHRLLTTKDAAGQTTTYTYNARGQTLTVTNAKNETITFGYDSNGYLTSLDGPLPGSGDKGFLTYDGFGRLRTQTDESGYTLTYEYDALDRPTKVTYPDNTFEQFTYTNLDATAIRDRAARVTSYEFTPLREVSKKTDPLGRVTRYEWCKCDGLASLTDPMGRTTTWENDVQDRVTAKVYADGSRESYFYEKSTSRLRERVDEKLQATQYGYERDDNLRSISYSNATVPTPAVTFTYDADYDRLTSMTDGSGTTRYSYIPVSSSPSLGAGELAGIDGPVPNDTITYSYDALGRVVGRAIDGAAWQTTFDPAGRITGMTHALGAFTFGYDGPSGRLLSAGYPNGQALSLAYEGNANDRRLNRITQTRASTALSEFLYTHDSTRNRLTSWSQKAGTASPVSFALGYNAVNELTSATGSQNAAVVKTFGYAYDPAQNRVSEQLDGGPLRIASHNALNELTSVNNSPATAATYEWDAEQRLTAVNVGTQRTEFSYDGLGRRTRIRELNNAAETSDRRFVWCDGEICEERTAAGSVVKRFFPQGVKVETGASPGRYFYTKDHLGSIRELVDEAGTVRARYEYEPYGARTKVSGDLEADFGYTGHLTHGSTGLCLTWYRAYDPRLGRWLSRDPFPNAEFVLSSNLYNYTYNDPVNYFDPDGRSPGAVAVGVAVGVAVYIVYDNYKNPQLWHWGDLWPSDKPKDDPFSHFGPVPDKPVPAPAPKPPGPTPPTPPAPPAPAPPAPAPPAPPGPGGGGGGGAKPPKPCVPILPGVCPPGKPPKKPPKPAKPPKPPCP